MSVRVKQWLPSIDGNSLKITEKLPAKSTKRHEREVNSIIARKQDLSPATYRRGKYVLRYGSPKIIELCEKGELSVWAAYQLVQITEYYKKEAKN